MAKDNLPYPLQFDPSQWSNQFSLYNNQPFPWPSSYVGTPTDALGNPIAAPQGTTLNQTATTPQAPQQQDINALWQAALRDQPGAQQAYGANFAPAGSPAGIQGLYGRNFMGFTPNQGWTGNTQAAAQPAAAPANNWSQTLAMLANPGHVTTQGANVPQSTMSGGPQPGVLQSFLKNWQPAQSGPGAGFQQNFNSILRGLQGT